jgi:hypothetical protein
MANRMNMAHLQFLEFRGIGTFYLGSMASSKVLLFLGRSNNQKNSRPLEELLDRLLLKGYLMLWPGTKNQFIRRFLSDRSESLTHWLDRTLGPSESSIKRYVLRLIKVLILIFYPSKWDFFLKWRDIEVVNQTESVRQIIRALGKNRSLYIISHSAGGITASNLHDEPDLKRIICFGYPFKHPDRDDESYRTENLKFIKIPFLIIQGDRDEYGGAGIENRYKLSPKIEVELVDSTHDYEDLSKDDWLRISKKIKSFLD